MSGYDATQHANRHIPHLDAVNALARLHYSRAKHAGPELEGTAQALRALPTVLRYLRQEANDEDSVLNRNPERFSVARYLHPLIEQTNFVLHELGEVLDQAEKVKDDGYQSRAEVEEFERVARRVEKKLAKQKARIEDFLDEVQLQDTPPPIPPKVAIDDSNLETLKAKLDQISMKLFKKRGSNLSEPEDDLWEQFSTELEHEGFDRAKLRKHKEILRAYIRNLETAVLDDNENNRMPPTVNGLLEQEHKHQSERPLSPGASRMTMEKASTFPLDRQNPPPSPPLSNNDSSSSGHRLKHASTGLSLDTMDENTSTSSGPDTDPMALISTRDLLEMDRQEQMHKSLGSSMTGLNLYPPPPQFAQVDLPNYTFSPGASPRLPHKLPSSDFPPSDTFIAGAQHYRSLPPAGTSLTGPSSNSDVATVPRLHKKLEPDGRGHDIPIDATWTKIRRSLVSPQVLAEAGVRYEARPTFVAILGSLSREKIADFARKTAELRASRSRRPRRSRTLEDDQYRAEQKEKHERERRKRNNLFQHRDDICNEESDTSSRYSDSSSRESEDDLNESRRPRYSSKRDAKSTVPRDSTLFIVDPVVSEEKASPSTTTAPKPILKNKNENRVHFDRNGTPFEVPNSPENSYSERRRRDDRDRRDRDRDRDRNRTRERDRDRDRESRRERERDRDRERYSRRHDRHDRERDRDSHRDRDRGRRQRHSDLIRAAGIGGAAASLLGVLAEAAVGL